MAAAQLPPLQFDEGGLQIVLLPSFEDGEAGSFDDPFADYFGRDDGETNETEGNGTPKLHSPKTTHELPGETLQPTAYQSRPHSPQQHRPDTAQTERASQPPPQRQQDELEQLGKQQLEPKTTHHSRQPSAQSFESDFETVHYAQDSPSTGDDSAPEHPIPAFQDAFAESLREATEGTAVQKPKLHEMDAKSRRELLLSQDKDAEPFDIKWRYRPGQTQHEVMKLVAQISFGVYLMFNGMANSNSQVIGILQGHIDEIDEFLEVTLEDLNQAVGDLTKRIQHLKLPMENITVFEQLLEDRKFRAEILDGNERIDGILTRTNAAMRQWDDDIEAGLRGSTVFASWLNDQADGGWREEQPDLIDVFDAMKGNTDGWLNAFEDMNDRAQEINGLIMTLMTIITEMESKAGEVSRRTWTSVAPFSTPAGTPLPPSTHKSVNGASPSPPPSRHSHAKSTIPSVSQVYVPNPLSLTPNESNKGDEDDDDDLFFPLPGGLPLLPPSNNRHRDNASVSSKPRSETIADSPTIHLPETRSEATSEDASLYILQPRTYTPQPPAPVPSPMLIASPSSAEPAPLRRRPSLRDRITNPPTSIQIPPTSTPDSPLYVPSSAFGTPRTTSSMHDLRSPENGYSRPPPRSRGASPLDTPTSDLRTFTPSPFSEHHAFQPVRASPHSPLQQRPHTAAGPQPQPRPGTGQMGHKPTPLGAMTNMSSVSVARPPMDRNHTSRSGMSQNTTDRQLKKKKSAFGWFKKAFTMDEDERAAFEARKAAASPPQQQQRYYDPNTPRFIDGRRIR
ncbi:hypothetical protein LMH87_006836 [Akanthomyces muscarius]|uniref:Uncharacterized protein n=1 Tax=Akanthomyces muscarius TaxID=2231603 RepID=A0A9W8QP28_AKAMU|nr:hypothetical protein LMH87_006836 [Akanthomyces muscarius]KAJ4165194.1 hypothetical protein LMH87_006836 [Akanthomyces muscarius]